MRTYYTRSILGEASTITFLKVTVKIYYLLFVLEDGCVTHTISSLLSDVVGLRDFPSHPVCSFLRKARAFSPKMRQLAQQQVLLYSVRTDGRNNTSCWASWYMFLL